MITWAVLRDILAVIGAGLSLILTALRFLDTRPVMVLEWIGRLGEGMSTYRLRIRNASRYPIHIGAITVWLPWKEHSAYGSIKGGGVDLRDYLASGMSRRLDVYLAEGNELFITFAFERPDLPRLLLAVSWYRHQPLILPTWPKLLYRGRRQLDQLREHPITADE
jgi:hypothetical protein